MLNAGLYRSLCNPDGLEHTAGIRPDGTRLIIAHHHLFKHAGMTIDDALRRNFGRRFVEDRHERRLHAAPAGLAEYLETHQDVQCLSTHNMRLPLPALPGARLLTITMLRHPIERVLSVYTWERNKQSSVVASFKQAARHSDLAGFVESCLSFDMVPAIRNYHISRLLPHPVDWRRPFTRDDLDCAKRNLEAVEMMGVVERFDESLVAFEAVLAPLFKNIDLACVTRNAAHIERACLETRLKALELQIGSPLFNRLSDANRLDMELYEYGQRLLESRLSDIVDLPAKLEDYRKRSRERRLAERRLLSRARRWLCWKLGC